LGVLRTSYAGAFDPDLTLADFSRQTLAHLGREYLLLGHLIDRVGIPLVVQRFGAAEQVQFSIDEWMGASPIYSRRMQKALGFEGDGVETVFKNMQLDIGAPPQFMDFQFRLDSPARGEFWLAHCGALLDVEPFGEKQVKLMCHDIEDPTFDATAAATNPRMRMRPIHRPPRVPADRAPHCRWSVFVDEDVSPHEPHPNLSVVQDSRIASISIDVPAEDAEPGGWTDYSHEFDPGLQLEDFGHRALLIVCQEAAVQSHLLVRAYLTNVAQRFGDDEAYELGTGQWTGSAAVAARRIARCLAIEGDGIDSIAKLFQTIPHFQPRTYVDLRVEITGEESARISIGDCPALEEGDPYSWLAQLESDAHPALDAICEAVNPYARCHPISRPGEAGLSWDVIIDRKREPQEVTPLLKLARLSRGVDFEMIPRRPLRS
jgi:hypothetical protein